MKTKSAFATPATSRPDQSGPKNERDRYSLIEVFCKICGIKIARENPLLQTVLEWN